MTQNKCIYLIFSTEPNKKYGQGGVEKYLSLFNGYAASKKIRCRYFTMMKKPYNFGAFNPFCNLFLSIILYLKIIFSNKKFNNVLFYAQDASYSGFSALIASRLLKIPLILHYHNSPMICYSALQPNNNFNILYILGNLVEKNVLSKSDHIITTNSSLKKIIKKYVLMPDQRISVLPIPIMLKKYDHPNLKQTAIRKELGISEKTFVIGFVGRFSEEKNIMLLVKAYDLFTKIIVKEKTKLILIGDGNQMSALKDFVKNLNLVDDVIFTGFRADIPRLLRCIDIFVLPSKTEGCPTSLLEAMASGKAIIASDIPAINDIVSDINCVMRFNHKSADDLKNSMLQLYRDDDLRKKLGNAAKKNAEKYRCGPILDETMQIIFNTTHN
jgi:glycosyltransferase involved in cell wall biosynthesis